MVKLLSSTVTQKGQATLPVEIRRLLKIKPGDQIFFQIEKNNTILLRKLSQQDFSWAASLEKSLVEWMDESDDNL